MFTERNIKWIEAVGAEFMERKNIDPKQYTKELVQGLRGFDELAIVITCAAFDIHCNVLLHEDYWTTRTANEYQNCIVRPPKSTTDIDSYL